MENSGKKIKKWYDLPLDPLLLIIEKLSTSIPDLFAVSGVCHSFCTAVFTATSRASDTPPLLLKPNIVRARDYIRWRSPRQISLQTLKPNIRSYESPLSIDTLNKRFLGCSNGNLIFDLGKKILIVNVFTNREIRSPKYPDEIKIEMGILTGPLGSEGSIHLLVGLSCTLCWKLDSKAWRVANLRYKMEISAFVVFDTKIYFLDAKYHVKVSTLNLPIECKTLRLELPTLPKLQGNFRRLDFVGVKWEKVDDLGDWCLFIDEGNCPMACSNSSRWRGRCNNIYLAGPADDKWTVFPLDGSKIDAVASNSTLSSSIYKGWPSPMWVYISKFLSRRE